MTTSPPPAPAAAPAPPAKRKPLPITANQVTVLRILALPFPCWALLARPPLAVMWVAFAFGAIVGCTDFVDGWMARRDGPTTLGALLDPVADKLFIVMLLLPLVAHGECPGWLAASLFVRELLITSLRSSMARREMSLKTSQLGKLKTVVQMGGIAAFFITVFVPEDALPTTLLAISAAFGLMALVWFIRTRGVPLWLIATPLLVLTIYAVAAFRRGDVGGEQAAREAGLTVFVLMVAFTWVSGADYLTGSIRAFRNTGGVTLPDVVRVLWSFAHGLALIPLLDDHFSAAHPLRGLAVPVIISLSAELALGGVENLVTAERKRWARGSVLPTMLAAIVVGVCAWANLVPENVLELAAWGLALFSVVNLGVAFWLDRDVFLVQKL